LTALPEAVAVDWNACAVPAEFESATVCTADVPRSVTPPAGGVVVLIVTERVAGVASTLPAASVARTDAVCVPFASVLVVHTLVQAAHVAESTRHWNAEPVSVELNAYVGVLSVVVPVGPEVIVVSGAVVSDAAVVPTVIALTVVAVSPSVSVTVMRMFFTLVCWNVNDMTLPLPSGHWVPPAPSVPSSTHVYEQGVSAHVAVEASKLTAWPAVAGAGV
jgi:hypothetical protein